MLAEEGEVLTSKVHLGEGGEEGEVLTSTITKMKTYIMTLKQ